MKANLSKMGKWPPKTFRKHYLVKVFVSRFREVENFIKTKRISISAEAGNPIRTPCEN